MRALFIFQKDNNIIYVHVCELHKYVARQQSHRWTARNVAALNLLPVFAPLTLCFVSVISIWRNTVSQLPSSEFYKGILCCLVGDFFPQYFEPPLIARPSDVAVAVAVAVAAATCSRWFLARGFFYLEDGGDTFLRNVWSHKIYTAPHPRRRHSS
jgi:hypothetical protein